MKHCVFMYSNKPKEAIAIIPSDRVKIDDVVVHVYNEGKYICSLWKASNTTITFKH